MQYVQSLSPYTLHNLKLKSFVSRGSSFQKYEFFFNLILIKKHTNNLAETPPKKVIAKQKIISLLHN